MAGPTPNLTDSRGPFNGSPALSALIAATRSPAPLADAEFRRIAANAAPYLR